jgi:hypothetical protein
MMTHDAYQDIEPRVDNGLASIACTPLYLGPGRIEIRV